MAAHFMVEYLGIIEAGKGSKRRPPTAAVACKGHLRRSRSRQKWKRVGAVPPTFDASIIIDQGSIIQSHHNICIDQNYQNTNPYKHIKGGMKECRRPRTKLEDPFLLSP